MPRNKKIKTALVKKQNKEIASRLLQISLKVDDYVYKNIPISQKSAVLFIKEVSGYKDKCYEDRASLQVIEKLIRCMTSIIAEQKELRQGCGPDPDDNIPLVDVESIPVSSVDEDLTQLTQNIIVYKILDLPNNDIDVIDLCDDRTDVNIDVSFIEKDLAVICNDELDKTLNKNDIQTNEHLQKATSNPTIEDDPLPITSLDPACSQSILNSFECLNNFDDGKRAHKNKITFNQGYEEDIRPILVSREHRNARSAKNVFSISLSKTQDALINLNISKTVKSTVHPKLSESNAQNNNNTSETVVKEKVRRKRGPNKTKKYNKDNERNKKPLVTRNKRNKNRGDITPITSEKMPENNNFAKGRNIPNGRSTNNNSSQAHCGQVQNYSTQTAQTPTLKAIYNQNVENDLSWIENIRFVREVTQDEIIPAFFEDSFWNNYTLPNDWNNDDFLYA